MDCSQYRDAIQELAEGTLGPVRRAALQTHLDQCDDCRALAADMQKIREAASSLDPVVRPPDHVWTQIVGRLRAEGRVSNPPPLTGNRFVLLAMAATLVLAIGGALYFMMPGPEQQPATVASGPTEQQPAATPAQGSGNAAAQDPVQSIANDFAQAERLYQSAIVKLEQAAKSDEGAIGPETAAVLTKNLQVIDQAIAESRAALEAQPQSAPARDSLFEALRRKVMLLQDTVALMNEMRKGNSAGAAQIVDGKS